MPFNGSGTFNPAITFVPNTLATAEDQNTQDSDFAAGLSDCLTRDGQAPATANISLGGYQINDMADPVVNTDAATQGWVITYVQSSTVSVRAAATGGTDTASTTDNLIYWDYAYSGTKNQILPAASAFKEGQQLTIKDKYGDAATNNISIVPQEGTIDLIGSYTLNIGKQAVTLVADTASNDWIIV